MKLAILVNLQKSPLLKKTYHPRLYHLSKINENVYTEQTI